MEYRSNKRTRYLDFLHALCGIAAAIFFLALSAPTLSVFGADAAMEVQALYGSAGRRQTVIPVIVNVYGQAEKPFSGTVAIQTLRNADSREYELCEYRYPVTAAAAEKKSVTAYVPLGDKSNTLTVQLRADHDEILQTETLSFDTQAERGRIYIGLLSGEPERLRWLSDLELNYGLMKTAAIDLNEESFPEDPRGLELLDILVLNDIRTDELTEAKRKAILSWVRDGGILLFGTGINARETLGEFGRSFLEKPVGIPRYRALRTGAASGDTEELYFVDVSVPDGRKIRISDTPANAGNPSGTETDTLLSVIGYGAGTVGFFTCDPGDLETFAAEHPGYAVRLLTELIGETALSELSYQFSYGDDSDFWTAQTLTGTGNTAALPNLPLYTAAITVYLIFAGPGLYLLLKRRSLSQYYGLSVGITALLGAAGIYLLGVGTRFSSEFYTCAAVMEYEGNEERETAWMNIRTPDGRPYSLQLGAEYRMRLLYEGSGWTDDFQSTGISRSSKPAVTVTQKEDGVMITVGKGRAFEPRYLKVTGNREVTAPVIAADLTVFDGRLSGTLTNDFSFPLSNALLVGNGQAYLISDTIKPGETVTFREEPLLTWPAGLPYLLSETAAAEADAQAQNLLSSYLSDLTDLQKNRLHLLVFGPESGIVSAPGRDELSDSRTLYAVSLAVDNEQNGLIWQSGQRIAPTVTSGSGVVYSDAIYLYGSDTLTAEYSLGDGELNRLVFLPVSEALLTGEDTYLEPFTGEAALYNQKTRTYDSFAPNGRTFTAEELSPYLTPDNRITVRYTGKDEGDGTRTELLPQVMTVMKTGENQDA